MGHWVHAVCAGDPAEHLAGLEGYLRSLAPGAGGLGAVVRVESGPPLPPPFHLDWITVALPDERAPGEEQSFDVVHSDDVEAEATDFRGLLASGRYTVSSQRGRTEVGEALDRVTHILSIRLGDGQSATGARAIARATALWFAGRTSGLALDGECWLAPPEGIEIV